MWTYLYVNCWCTEEPAACTTFLPLDSSRCCWFSLWRTRPLSSSARTALWYSIQNKMPYVNKRTLLTVTSCIGLLWAWESLLNWSQRAFLPSVFWLTSAVSLHCLLLRVTDLQASNFRLLSLLCQWTCCSIPLATVSSAPCATAVTNHASEIEGYRMPHGPIFSTSL